MTLSYIYNFKFISFLKHFSFFTDVSEAFAGMRFNWEKGGANQKGQICSKRSEKHGVVGVVAWWLLRLVFV